MKSEYHIYMRSSEREDAGRVALPNLSFSFWRPGPRDLIPAGMNAKFGFWWLFHYLRIFKNKDYSVLFVLKDGKIVHRSCVVPAYFRWPFMSSDDLQISSTWTASEYRGQGLGTMALQYIVREKGKLNRRFWYVTREDNPASISVCKKAGFRLFSKAERENFFGSRLLGRLSLKNNESVTMNWYESYYSRLGSDRNSLARNKGVLFQTLAMEASVVGAMRNLRGDLAAVKLLDVGCGGAQNLFQFLRLGIRAENITGIDILQDRIREALKLYPQSRFICGDAGKTQFSDSEFDLVSEFTMFATLPDEELSARIAGEMVRVCKPGGHILLVDWRTPKPGDANYLALAKRRLKKIFKVGEQAEMVGVYPGALVPPLGRFLSKYLPSIYFLVAACFPLLVGQVTYVLRKRDVGGI